MRINSPHPQLHWVRLDHNLKPLFEDEPFEGSLEEAITEMELRAIRREFMLGQVLDKDGRVVKNIPCPRSP